MIEFVCFIVGVAVGVLGVRNGPAAVQFYRESRRLHMPRRRALRSALVVLLLGDGK